MGQTHAGIILVGVAEAIGLTLCVFLFGIGLIAPLEIALLATGLGMRGTTLSMNFIACHIAFGFYVCTILFLNQFFFLNIIIGAASIVLLVQNFGTRNQGVIQMEQL